MTTQTTKRYIRYRADNVQGYGLLDGDSVQPIADAPYIDATPNGAPLNVSDVMLLAPVAPSKIIAIGLNYKSHLGERPALEYPGMFAKFPSAIVANLDAIVLPKDSKSVHYEGEMVIVIGKTVHKATPQQAASAVFGVTIGNDVSERTWQKSDLQWLRAKSSDTFAPIGPYLVTGLDYGNLLLETRVNGEVRQSSNTNLLIFDIPTLVSYVSQYLTLLPGDVIFTGTPGTTQQLAPGDVVEVSLEGVGVLSNMVVAEK